ncbi:hypothetical protein [Pedobacter sandarakinus]|uniref:hypothetical protein n=1 Tax=Pedobacter sandarakinus TaxID=353156 RepID=UPI0022466C0E|nr:hypothetical protein [Pedobacter sandarakinus]MCX2574993.1 hypothetical protein [Pedobacter sandarakinus]
MPQPQENNNRKLDQEKSVDGMDNWNNRLDENLEEKDQNDPLADKKAKNFSEHLDGEDTSEEKGD